MPKQDKFKDEMSQTVLNYIEQLVDNVISTSVEYTVEGEQVNFAQQRLVELPYKFFNMIAYLKDAKLNKEIAQKVYREKEEREEDPGRYDDKVAEIGEKIKPIEAEIALYELLSAICDIGHDKIVGKSYDRKCHIELADKFNKKRLAKVS